MKLNFFLFDKKKIVILTRKFEADKNNNPRKFSFQIGMLIFKQKKGYYDKLKLRNSSSSGI